MGSCLAVVRSGTWAMLSASCAVNGIAQAPGQVRVLVKAPTTIRDLTIIRNQFFVGCIQKDLRASRALQHPSVGTQRVMCMAVTVNGLSD
jgi:hypothetical protein